MEARELAEQLKAAVDVGDEPGSYGILGGDAETAFAYGDADFFVELDGEGKFLVSVVKVAE